MRCSVGACSMHFGWLYTWCSLRSGFYVMFIVFLLVACLEQVVFVFIWFIYICSFCIIFFWWLRLYDLFDDRVLRVNKDRFIIKSTKYEHMTSKLVLFFFCRLWHDFLHKFSYLPSSSAFFFQSIYSDFIILKKKRNTKKLHMFPKGFYMFHNHNRKVMF